VGLQLLPAKQGELRSYHSDSCPSPTGKAQLSLTAVTPMEREGRVRGVDDIVRTIEKFIVKIAYTS